MKKEKIFYGKICLALVLSLFLVTSIADAETPDIVQKQKNAVVTAYVNDKNGKHIFSESGFVVDREGIIAVSCNIISRWLKEIENTIVVEVEGGDSFPMRHVISDNCRNNFVLLKVEVEELPTVTLSSDYKPRQGEGIVVMSRSSGSGTTVLNGRISNIREKDGIFQVTAPVTQERDGSPVFNLEGEVIGMLTLLPGKRQKQHIIIPVKYLSKEFSRYRPLIRETSAPSSRAIHPAPVSVPEASEKTQTGKIQEDAEQQFLRGCSYEKSNMYREAIEAYTEALRIKTDYVEAYINLGLAYYKLGRYAEAVDAYKHAIKIKPGALSVYNKMGAAYIILGEYSLALDAFKQSIKIDPNNSETHFNLGVAFVIIGDRNGAVEEYITLKKLDRERADKLLDLIY